MEIYAALVLALAGIGAFAIASGISYLLDVFINFWTSGE